METKKLSLRDEQVNLQYYEAGTGPVTLLFSHGWCIDGSHWQHQIEHFAKNYRVIAPDLPGFGGSLAANRTDWSSANYARDLIALIDQLDLQNIVLAGHSMSGEIVLQVALKVPERIKGLVGVDTFGMVDMPFPAEQMAEFQQFATRLKADFHPTATAWAGQLLFQPSTPDEVRERVLEGIRRTEAHIGYETLAAMWAFAPEVSGLLAQSPFLLHLLNSNAGPTYEPGLAACKNGYKIHHISATGHYPMTEKPEDFNRIFQQILDEL